MKAEIPIRSNLFFNRNLLYIAIEFKEIQAFHIHFDYCFHLKKERNDFVKVYNKNIYLEIKRIFSVILYPSTVAGTDTGDTT